MFHQTSGLSNGHLLALLAQMFGDLVAAEHEFVTATTALVELGYRPEAAWALYHHGVFLDEHAQPRDAKRAAVQLDRALALASELGMKPLIERIVSRKKILRA